MSLSKLPMAVGDIQKRSGLGRRNCIFPNVLGMRVGILRNYGRVPEGTKQKGVRK